jgi:hypothetical protein
VYQVGTPVAQVLVLLCRRIGGASAVPVVLHDAAVVPTQVLLLLLLRRPVPCRRAGCCHTPTPTPGGRWGQGSQTRDGEGCGLRSRA